MIDKSTCHVCCCGEQLFAHKLTVNEAGVTCVENRGRVCERNHLNTFPRMNPSSKLGRLWSGMTGMGAGAGLVVV